MSATRHLVVGTAGHIDHGKSTLVRALTGVDPDRLQEEQRRGITIELGFADLQLDEDRAVSFVDVPGHERFVRHMVAGASGIDAVVLVVAADQGPQPQTHEHLEICRLLGLRRGLLVLSKCDLADDDLREVAALELRERVEGTFLEQAPLIEVAARDGQGLDPLRRALADLFDDAEQRADSGVARLPVDRSFVLRGFGTVVTGTLAGGAFEAGDEVAVLPGDTTTRIRGLQRHGAAVDRVRAGQRAAINLQGVETGDVPRGATLTRPGALHVTDRLWARLELLPHVPERLHRGGSVRFHQGTLDVAGRFRVLGDPVDGALPVALFLEQSMPLAPGDAFVVRLPAPLGTCGGGRVVDTDPSPRRPSSFDLFAATATAADWALGRLRRVGSAGASAAELAPYLAWPTPAVAAMLERLADEGRLVALGADSWIMTHVAEELRGAAAARLDAFHREQPLSVGQPREVLRAEVARQMPVERWRAWLLGEQQAGRIQLHGDAAALPGHTVTLDGPAAQAAARIERRLLEAGCDPPELDGVLAELDPKVARPVVELLLNRGTLIKVKEGRLFHAEVLRELQERLLAHARTAPEIDVAAFKELAGITRKNAIPLLEYFDTVGVTRRLGDKRQILAGS